jgi:hypothetical protein
VLIFLSVMAHQHGSCCIDREGKQLQLQIYHSVGQAAFATLHTLTTSHGLYSHRGILQSLCALPNKASRRSANTPTCHASTAQVHT